MSMDWTAVDVRADARGGMYLGLVERIRDAIAREELQPGDRLPSERALAGTLGVSRTTVVNAYRELEARGLVRGHVGRGTFVCAAHADAADERAFAWHGKVALGSQRSIDTSLLSLVRTATDRSLVSFAAGVTALDCFPTARFAELTHRLLCEQSRDALGLAPTEGMPALRHALAQRERVATGRVMIVAGAQQGLDLAARLLVDPGDAVVMDRPGYLGAIPLFRAAGANVIGWNPTAGVEELEDLLLRFRPKLLYATPTFNNPSGQTWPVGLRRDVLELAERYRVPIVEDEPYRELFFDAPPPPSLSALSDGRGVIHIATFAKSLSGALRLGWVTAEETVINQLSMIKQRSDLCSPSLSQMTVAAMLESGAYDAHLARLRPELQRRCATMRAALAKLLPPHAMRVEPVTGGVFLWADLGAGPEARALLTEANRSGVTFVPGDLFYPDGNGRSHLRLCFSAQTPAAIVQGVHRIADALRRIASLDRARAPHEPLV